MTKALGNLSDKGNYYEPLSCVRIPESAFELKFILHKTEINKELRKDKKKYILIDVTQYQLYLSSSKAP